MSSEPLDSSNVVGRRMRSRREELGWSQEKVGVLIGIDESSSRARISRYELGTHEPPVKTARLIADALGSSFRIKHLSLGGGNRPMAPLMRSKGFAADAVAMPVESGESQISVSVSGQIELSNDTSN